MTALELKADMVEKLRKVSETPETEAFILLEHYYGMSRSEIILKNESVDALPKKKKQELDVALERRMAREPLQYILGEAPFRHLILKVGKGVLIPRPETELMVDWLKEHIVRFRSTPVRVLEIGCGSGAISISLLSELREMGVDLHGVTVDCVDISSAALEYSKQNREKYGLSKHINLVKSDVYSSLVIDKSGVQRYNVICSNPPYIAEFERNQLSPEVESYEPEEALFAGDGFDCYKKIIKGLNDFLTEDGEVILEIAPWQFDALKQMFMDDSRVEGKSIEGIRDYNGRVRFICLKN